MYMKRHLKANFMYDVYNYNRYIVDSVENYYILLNGKRQVVNILIKSIFLLYIYIYYNNCII